MKIKSYQNLSRFISILSLSLASHSFAEDPQALTQTQYNQLIAHFTKEVNATKKILDESENADASAQKQAFCARLNAYQHIAQLSQNNLQLETASVMLMVANQFLDRQKQSLVESGMTEQVFCAPSHSKMSENDMKLAENDN